jgi:hypothetical protein
MFVETINQFHAGRKVAMQQYLLPLFIAFVFALTIYASNAQAQIIGDLEVNVPFPFHAGNTKLPHPYTRQLRPYRYGNQQRGWLYIRSFRSPRGRSQLDTGQERIDLQQIRQSLLPCEVV